MHSRLPCFLYDLILTLISTLPFTVPLTFIYVRWQTRLHLFAGCGAAWLQLNCSQILLLCKLREREIREREFRQISHATEICLTLAYCNHMHYFVITWFSEMSSGKVIRGHGTFTKKGAGILSRCDRCVDREVVLSQPCSPVFVFILCHLLSMAFFLRVRLSEMLLGFVMALLCVVLC